MTDMGATTSSLAQSIFNEKVAFPALEHLDITSLPNEQIWDDSAGRIENSFCNLRVLQVSRCDNLVNVISSRPRLHRMGEIFVMESRDVFGLLKKLRLSQLPRLRTFCSNAGDEDFTQAQTLFNDKVDFPALEELEIEALPNKQIWDDSAVEVENSFRNLRVLEVKRCGNLVNVITSSMRRRLNQLKELSIRECDSVVSVFEEGIFSSAQAEEAIEFVLGLSDLNLSGLKSLISTGLENAEYRGPCSNLTILKVIECPLLKNAVLSSSIATELVHLQELEISDCKGIEEVVAKEQAGEENREAKHQVIVFSALKKLRLNNLPNFRTFCRSRSQKEYAQDEEPLFNHQVAFPALEELKIEALPNKQIWDDSAVEVENSFCNLRVLEVERCGNLANVITSSMRRRLHQLKELSIRECDSVVSVVEEGIFPSAQAGAAIELVLGLSDLNLSGLKSFISTGLENVEYRGPCSNLTILKVIKCPLLKNAVLSSSIATKLLHLQEVEISDCEGIEEVVAKEQAGEENREAKHQVIVFPALKKLRLNKLPNFRTFCRTRSQKEYAKDEEPLFNHQIAFPALEELTLQSLPNTQVLSDDFGKVENLFGNLRVLRVLFCKRLVNVIPFSMMSYLLQLVELYIWWCDSIVSIIEESEETKDHIIVFPLLKKLHLWQLPRLRTFCSSRSKLNARDEDFTQVQALFNHKVAFPALESLVINALPNKQIWDDSAGEVENSFCNLRVLLMVFCDNLVNAISSSMRPRLHQLKKLVIGDCNSVVSIVEEGIFSSAPVGVTTEFVLGLSQLELRGLKRLISTGLENEEYRGAPSNLTNLRVKRCPILKNAVLSSSIATKLVHLQELEISDCEGIEEVVAMEKAGAECQEAKNHLIVFLELKKLCLNKLPNFRTFCRTRSQKEYAKYEKPLFNRQVLFPELEKCSISGVNSNVIFGGRLPLHSFDKLTELEIVSCDNLSTVVPADLLPRLQNLQSLIVKECREVTEVFELEGLNVSGGQVELLSKLECLSLSELPKLHCVWNNKDPHPILCLQSLEVVEIDGCHFLRNLFSPSISATLVRLRLLKVCSCKRMEEIVSNEEKEREMIDEIALTGLEDILLEDLLNLKSFCSGNCAFKLPSLRKVELTECTEIQNFISGKVSMPEDVTDGYGNQLSDLNEYARRQAMELSQLLRNLFYPDEDDGANHNVNEEDNNDVP